MLAERLLFRLTILIVGAGVKESLSLSLTMCLDSWVVHAALSSIIQAYLLRSGCDNNGCASKRTPREEAGGWRVETLGAS